MTPTRLSLWTKTNSLPWLRAHTNKILTLELVQHAGIVSNPFVRHETECRPAAGDCYPGSFVPGIDHDY